MTFVKMMIFSIFLAASVGFSCGGDEKFGGGNVGHQAYLNWLSNQDLDVQIKKNNGKMVTQTSDYFKTEKQRPLPPHEDEGRERGINRVTPYVDANE